MSGPSMTVDRYGGIYEIKMQPRFRWWQRRKRREYEETGRRQLETYGLLNNLFWHEDDVTRWSRSRELTLRREAYRRATMRGEL